MRSNSKYSKAQTDDWTGRIAIVLAGTKESLSIPEIQNRDAALTGISTQKMSRMLNHLVDFNLVSKTKGMGGRMVYRSLVE